MLQPVFVQDLRITQHFDNTPDRGGRETWTVQIDDGLCLQDVAPIEAQSGNVEICNCEYDYELPYILARVVGDVVIWFNNPRFVQWPDFNGLVVVAFERKSYGQEFPGRSSGLPPAASTIEIEQLAKLAQERLPSHQDAEYCIPEYQHDQSGRSLLKEFRDSLCCEQSTVVSEWTASQLHKNRTQFEIGTSDRELIVLDTCVVEGIKWHRLLRPAIFPVWIGRSV